MINKRRTFSNEFKAKMALEAIREDATINEIARRHQVHPNQISQWKREALENLSVVFAKGKQVKEFRERHKKQTDRLYQQIGHLQVEVDFLKEFCEERSLPVPASELR